MGTKNKLTATQLIRYVSKGYPDDFIYQNCWDKRSSVPVADISECGDGLAGFLAQEIYETFDEDADKATQINTAIDVLERATNELNNCMLALIKLRIKVTSKGEHERSI